VGLFNEKDRMDGGKRMASNWEVILTPFLNGKANAKRTQRNSIFDKQGTWLYKILSGLFI